MIEIDLLPLELREKKKTLFEQIFKIRFVFAVLACLVILHLFLQAINVINIKRLNKFKKRWQGLSFERAQIDQLKGAFAKIDKKIPLIEQLISNRVLWSKKLNRVNDLLISGIWLREITVQRQKAKDKSAQYLMIRGSAASRMKDEPALIGRFMQNLKEDPSFSADFAEIELGPIKKRLIKQTEVMDFVLICRFRPLKAQSLLR